MVSDLVEKGSYKDKGQVIENVSLDWGVRIGFMSSMVAAMVSVFSIFSSTRSYEWAGGTLLLLLAIFVPMLLWIISHGAGDLVATRTKRGKILHVSICEAVLLVVNGLLIVAIAVSQVLRSASVAAAPGG
jgi:hypothetical protein